MGPRRTIADPLEVRVLVARFERVKALLRDKIALINASITALIYVIHHISLETTILTGSYD
jgi:hypothetical protein